MSEENKMYNYLLNHNYISENKKSNYQSELSIERAECIANKFNSLVEEEKTNLKQALAEAIEYIENHMRYNTGMNCGDMVGLIDILKGDNNE